MRRLPWFALVVALAAGCGGSSDSPRTLPPAPSPSASPSPAPSPTGTPREQVLAAVRNYYATLNHTGSTADTAPLLRLSTPECACRDVASYIDQLTKKGQRLQNARDEVLSVSVQQVTAEFATVLVRYRSPEHQVIEVASGKVLESFPSKEVSAQLALKPVSGQWLVAVVREV
jgi:hypothetical protein